MGNALIVTGDASKAFRIQQVLTSVGYSSTAVNGIDSLFGCIQAECPDIIVVSDLDISGKTTYDIIKVIREYGAQANQLPIIHLWAGLSLVTSGAMGGPVVRVVEPFTLPAAKSALASLGIQQ